MARTDADNGWMGAGPGGFSGIRDGGRAEAFEICEFPSICASVSLWLKKLRFLSVFGIASKSVSWYTAVATEKAVPMAVS